MYRPVPTTAPTTRGGSPTDNVDPVVTLDQVPRWSDPESRYPLEYEADDPTFSNSYFPDPLTLSSQGESSSNGLVSRFPVDQDINSKIYLWRGNPWNLEVDAVVNSANENLDEAHSSPGLHAAAGPGLAEECTTLGGCRTGMAKVTSAYDLPARRVIHTVGPKYAVKYHTAAENALSHCYRACLELLIDNGLRTVAMGCIYTEAKNYPREPAAHVAIRTVRRFLEKQKDKIKAVVFCTVTTTDTEIYKRLLPLYFPRDKHEEEVANLKLPADVGDENGETIIDERKIRIKPLPKKTIPKPPQTPVDLPVSDVGLVRRTSSYLDSYLDPAFMSLIKDPDQRRKEQWEKTAQAQSGWNCVKMLGFGNLGTPPLSAAEEYSLHSRYLAKANSLNLSDIAEMKIVYRGGVDSEGRPVMVIVGAHFLLRCMDMERFVFYLVKEFEPVIQKPYTVVYFHSAASIQLFSCILTLAEKHEATKLQAIKHYTKDLKICDMDGNEEFYFPSEREVRMMGDKGLSDPKPVDGKLSLSLIRMAVDERSHSCIGHFCNRTDTILYRVNLLQNILNVNPLDSHDWVQGMGAIHGSLNKKCLPLCSFHASDLYMGRITLQDIDCTRFVELD